MKSTLLMSVAGLASALGLALPMTYAQQSEIRRTAIGRQDLGVVDREVSQVRVDFPPGAAFPRHSHPGTEVAFVLDGTLEYQFDGESPVILRAGQALFIPPGTIHTAKNVGANSASELATYVVEKNKPLVVLAH